METVKKVKLLQNLPNVDKGAIFENNNFGYFKVVDNYGEWFSINECVVLEKTDWFAPYLFTSFDGKDIFKGDYVCIVTMSDTIKEVFNYKSLQQDEHCLYFSKKEKAEEYRDNLNLKFKVGDIVNVDCYCYDIVGKVNEIKDNRLLVDTTWVDNIDITYATNEEIIKYYEKQGWIKRAKFKTEYGGTIVLFEMEVLYNNVADLSVRGEFTSWYRIKNCELIKEPEYPKSWEEIQDKEQDYYYIYDEEEYCVTKLKHRNNYSSESQCKSALAFSQLTQLHAEIIKIYNEANNCDWKPDWNDDAQNKFVITRTRNRLNLFNSKTEWRHLAFPDTISAQFSYDNHSELWKKLYELNKPV